MKDLQQRVSDKTPIFIGRIFETNNTSRYSKSKSKPHLYDNYFTDYYFISDRKLSVTDVAKLLDILDNVNKKNRFSPWDKFKLEIYGQVTARTKKVKIKESDFSI